MTDDLEERMLRHVQSIAAGVLLDWLMAAYFKSARDPGGLADQWLKRAELSADKMTFPEVDPVLSDVAAQEFRDTLVRHIHRAKALATGQPFDPTTFRKRAPGSD